MRLNNSIRNMKYNTISQVVSLIVQFIGRTFFIRVLGNEYLAINGLFSNILTLLSLTDMGIGYVLIYSMYEPLANKNEQKLKELMNEYKKIYTVIAIIVLILGLSITPFLNIFIKETPNIPNIEFIFILYLLNTVVTYLCIYKISIINADQKNYIVTLAQQIFNIVSNIIMIFILLLTHNFIAYLVVQIFSSIFSNIYVSKKAEKMYPFIKDSKGNKLSENEKNKIKKDTFAMLFHKIGGVILSGTDNLIMSTMVGLKEVGIYSNYLLIINTIRRFTLQYFTSMSASIGNLNVETTTEYSYSIFKKVFFGNFWIYTFCTICLYTLLNPFINLWIGSEYTFSSGIVLVIVLMFYVEGMRQTVISFRSAMGIFTQDKWRPILEAFLNLVISLVLTQKFGIVGIFLGTVLSMLLTCTWLEPLILFKYGFKLKVRKYFKMYFKFIIIGTVAFIVTYLADSLIVGDSIGSLVLHFIVTILVSNISLMLMTFKMEEFKYFFDILKNILRKTLGKFKYEKTN